MSIWGFHPSILDCELLLYICRDQWASKQAKSWLSSATLTWSHNANEIDWQKAVSGQIGPSWSISISPDQEMLDVKLQFSAVAEERSIKNSYEGSVILCTCLRVCWGAAQDFCLVYKVPCSGAVPCRNCLPAFRDVRNGDIELAGFSLGATWLAVILSVVFTPLPVSTNTVLGDTCLLSSDAVCKSWICYLAKFRGRNVQHRKWG